MRNRIKLLLYVAVVSLTLSTLLFLFFEERVNPAVNNAFDVIWWWVVTSATVGYGDVAPVTWPGKLVGIFTILTGFFIYANFVAIIAESVHGFMERRERGKAQINVRNHIVLCEYTAIADELIQSIPDCPELAERDVVIVSDLVSMNPYHQHYFVCGVPINPAVLNLANTAYADYVFIFANFRFADPDVKTMHIASRVVALAPNAKVFVEMVDMKSDLLKYAPEGVVALDSRELIVSVLRDKKVDPSGWLHFKRPA